MKRILRSKLLFRNDAATPLGRLSIAGYAFKQNGADFRSTRVLGSYALVYLLEGAGSFQAANGVAAPLHKGDAAILFPEIAHRYGPLRGGSWSEIFVVFDGPAFDLWREAGVLRPAHPIAHLQPVAQWRAQLEAILRAPHELETVTEFLHFLARVASSQSLPSIDEEEVWLAQARRALEENLSDSLDLKRVARQSGMSYESFRKRFAIETGNAPARYRAQRRVEAAGVLLRQTSMTLRAIAQSLGFSDEFHFSRRFKAATGHTPRAFRHAPSAEEKPEITAKKSRGRSV